MRVAVLGDIHGNLRALEAVLSDVKTSDVDQLIFLGDLVYNGLDPQLCFDLLMETKPLVCIKGNSDEYLEQIATFTVKDKDDAQLLKLYKYTAIRLQDEAKAAVAAFKDSAHLDLEGISFLACHGSPLPNTEALTERKPFAPLLSKQLAAEKVDVVLSAYTHVPADFSREGIRFINPGAVGYSFDGDTARVGAAHPRQGGDDRQDQTGGVRHQSVQDGGGARHPELPPLQRAPTPSTTQGC